MYFAPFLNDSLFWKLVTSSFEEECAGRNKNENTTVNGDYGAGCPRNHPGGSWLFWQRPLLLVGIIDFIDSRMDSVEPS